MRKTRGINKETNVFQRDDHRRKLLRMGFSRTPRYGQIVILQHVVLPVSVSHRHLNVRFSQTHD
jgi:hypothetical protein